ncbi:MAG: BofC C-terminal domain-containing protein, partial [Clostridia bacterium]|nr:BofC C-terminal domain-containing protein [Clostridia bacterium]
EDQSEMMLVQRNGSILLVKNQNILEEFHDISLENLPVKDRMELEKGIKVSSMEEAMQRIEDFDG